jgi:enoyl-CoA hydratase/carnithine racemase
MKPPLDYSVHDGVARITLRRADKFNAMSRAMWRALREALDAVATDATLRCAVLRGEGGHFCAGGDIAEYPAFRFDPVQLRHFHEVEVWGALQALLDCPVPAVALIEGNCMGAGLEMASCCDIRLATQSARFGAPIARLGFPMAPREAALVSRAVGDATARAMLLAAALFDAPQMAARGFLTATVADGELDAAGEAMVQRIVALAPQAARLNKQTFSALNGLAGQEIRGHDAIKSRAYGSPNPYAYAASEEHREGISAFLDKRQPHF